MSKLASRMVAAAFLAALIISAPLRAAEPKGRAVSLNALAASMKGGGSADAEALCGVTSVLGYIIDPASRDVVLIGKVDPHEPALHVDDLTVAIRNVWGVYDKVQGRVRYYAAPGCSIDPDPKVLRELDEITKPQLDTADEGARKDFTDRWKEIGSRPQRVRVMGVPFDSRFSKVMVDADYYMKRLVNGSVSLGIDGFESLTQTQTRLAMQAFKDGKPEAVRTNSISRFWFSPRSATFEEKNGAVLLRDCSVKLLTEEEFLTSHNVVAGLGRPHPLAAGFAGQFTDKYSDIAAARPIYTQLQSLFRFVALARLLKDDPSGASSTNGIKYLLKYHRVQCVPVSRAVNGLADVCFLSEKVDISDGTTTTFGIVQSFCGGVCMDVRPKRIGSPAKPRRAATYTPRPEPSRPSAPRTVKAPKAPETRNVVLRARKSSKQVSWDISLAGLD